MTLPVQLLILSTLIVTAFIAIPSLQTASAEYVLDRSWGTPGSGDGTQFRRPSDVAIDSSKNVFIADYKNIRIQEFKLASPCPTGTTQVVVGVCFVTKWGTPGNGNGQFNLPLGVGTDSSGHVYVAETVNKRIQKFKLSSPCPTGTTQVVVGVCFVTKWGTEGNGNGQFSFPTDVATDSSGNVYVTDSGNNNRIQKFTKDGAFITAWGKMGSGPGEFIRPNSVDVDRSGYVYVTDTGNHRIQKFTKDGAFITAWGKMGSGPGEFSDPRGVSVDSSLNIFVADDRVQKYANDGTFLEEFSIPSNVSSPYGLDVVNTGTVVLNQYVFVSDFAFSIQVFKYKPVIQPGFNGSIQNSTQSNLMQEQLNQTNRSS